MGHNDAQLENAETGAGKNAITLDQRVHDDLEWVIHFCVSCGLQLTDDGRCPAHVWQRAYSRRVRVVPAERAEKAEAERDNAETESRRMQERLTRLIEGSNSLRRERDELAAALERILNPKLRVGEVTGIVLSYDDWEAARAVLARVRGRA